MTIDISSSTTAMSMKEIDELIVNKLYQQPNTQQNHQEINKQKLLPEQALPTLNVCNDNNHEYDIQELAIFKKLIKQFEDFVNRQNLEKGPIYYVYFILHTFTFSLENMCIR